ncbi:MAG TPA: response regulator [Mucilaginibacter sp.]|nr:response regulator [Mucilaginibacter sp.]
MKKILFIDDSPLDHFILKRILTKYKLPYEVTCTDNGQEVIGFLERHRTDKNSLPDIILLDIYMPRLNGWAFLDKMQLLYPKMAKQARIYILSSSINPTDIQHAKQYPFVSAFIFKPITKEVLEKLINVEVSDFID